MGELRGRDGRARALTAAEIAWVVLLPCAVLAVLAIALLGGPLGRVLFDPSGAQLWPPGWWESSGSPEPVKQGRFMLAVIAPLLPMAVVVVAARRPLVLAPRVVRASSIAGSALLLALVAVALLAQDPRLGAVRSAHVVLGLGTVLAAIALVTAALALLRQRAVGERVAALARETPARRWIALALAAAAAAPWLLGALTTDRLAADMQGINLPWTINDAFAVLDGRTPLVDYNPIYAKLLPYPTALALAAFGSTVFVYTVFMAVLDAFVLAAVYATFRILTRSSLLALGLFAPFVAASDVDPRTDPTGVGSPLTLSAMWPIRYGGAYLLAWLAARHLDGRWPRRPWILFLAGGLVAVNSVEFGGAAVAATLVAVLCARPPRSLRELGRLAAHVAGGMAVALALVAVFTLVRAGEAPQLDLLLEWPRIFTRLGLLSMPLRLWDLHLAFYATFAAALIIAAVRLARADDGAPLTGMLAWSGAFGLLAGGYYVGRPDVFKLTALFTVWSFALTMLTIVCVRELAARGWRRPTLPQALVLFGFALSVCLIARVTPPQREVDRLTADVPAATYLPAAERFVGSLAQRGETVAILLPMSHRVAYALGLDNVSPYPFMNAIVTQRQLRALLDVLERQRVRKLFVPLPESFLAQEGDSAPQQLEVLQRAGYRLNATADGIGELERTSWPGEGEAG